MRAGLSGRWLLLLLLQLLQGIVLLPLLSLDPGLHVMAGAYSYSDEHAGGGMQGRHGPSRRLGSYASSGFSRCDVTDSQLNDPNYILSNAKLKA